MNTVWPHSCLRWLLGTSGSPAAMTLDFSQLTPFGLVLCACFKPQMQYLCSLLWHHVPGDKLAWCWNGYNTDQHSPPLLILSIQGTAERERPRLATWGRQKQRNRMMAAEELVPSPPGGRPHTDLQQPLKVFFIEAGIERSGCVPERARVRVLQTWIWTSTRPFVPWAIKTGLWQHWIPRRVERTEWAQARKSPSTVLGTDSGKVAERVNLTSPHLKKKNVFCNYVWWQM